MPELHVSPDEGPGEGERLLSQDDHFAEMRGLNSSQRIQSEREEGLLEDADPLELSRTESTFQVTAEANGGGPTVQYRVYKRRWFGLVQLILLNIVVSWDVSQEPPYGLPTRIK